MSGKFKAKTSDLLKVSKFIADESVLDEVTIERMGEYAVAHTNDSYCIGFCWYGSGVIWIDVNYHDLKWGSDQKEFRKNIDHTIAHEMVHLRFNNINDSEHVDHQGSKRRRAFDRRTNQVLRGKRY